MRRWLWLTLGVIACGLIGALVWGAMQTRSPAVVYLGTDARTRVFLSGLRGPQELLDIACEPHSGDVVASSLSGGRARLTRWQQSGERVADVLLPKALDAVSTLYTRRGLLSLLARDRATGRLLEVQWSGPSRDPLSLRDLGDVHPVGFDRTLDPAAALRLRQLMDELGFTPPVHEGQDVLDPRMVVSWFCVNAQALGGARLAWSEGLRVVALAVDLDWPVYIGVRRGSSYRKEDVGPAVAQAVGLSAPPVPTRVLTLEASGERVGLCLVVGRADAAQAFVVWIETGPNRIGVRPAMPGILARTLRSYDSAPTPSGLAGRTTVR